MMCNPIIGGFVLNQLVGGSKKPPDPPAPIPIPQPQNYGNSADDAKAARRRMMGAMGYQSTIGGGLQSTTTGKTLTGQ